MPIYAYAGIRPVIDRTAYVHPQAVVIGDVIIGLATHQFSLALHSGGGGIRRCRHV
jgi:phenylacetic acid degradation protein